MRVDTEKRICSLQGLTAQHNGEGSRELGNDPQLKQKLNVRHAFQFSVGGRQARCALGDRQKRFFPAVIRDCKAGVKEYNNIRAWNTFLRKNGLIVVVTDRRSSEGAGIV